MAAEQPTSYGGGASKMLPFPTEDGPYSFGAWLKRITASEEKRDRLKSLWKDNVNRYRGKYLESKPDHDVIVVPKDYANVEQKKAQLFFQSPEVQLTALLPGMEKTGQLFQAVLNHHLGSSEINAKRMIDEVLFDLLCPAGIGVSVIGYENVVDGVVPLPPAGPQQPMQPGMPSPQPQMVPNIIFERYFWDRISPLNVLIPDDFHGSDYDKAPWLGYKDFIQREHAAILYNIPIDLLPSGSTGPEADDLLSSEEYVTSARSGMLTRYELYYRASVFDPKERNPEQFRKLCLIKGLDRPAAHENCKYQRKDQMGKLYGMMGNPIHIFALRYVSDSAYPQSDCTVSRLQVDELGKSRTQMLLQRDRNIPQRFVDIQRVGGQATVDKLNRSPYQAWIPVTGIDDNMVKEVAQARFPRENFEFNQIINKDIDEAWALSATQRAQETDDVRSATEIQKIATASETRMESERNRFLQSYVKGVEKIAALIQLFADQRSYVRVVGQDGGSWLQQWDKTMVQGKYAFSIKPDSSIRIDVQQDRRQLMQLYNLLANDPNVARAELTAPLLRKFNFDPERILKPPPPKGPDPPNISFRFGGDELNPAHPAFAIVMEILAQGGIKVSQEAVQAASMQAAQMTLSAAATGQGEPGMDEEHGGTAQPAKVLNKHQGEETGQMSGPSVQ